MVSAINALSAGDVDEIGQSILDCSERGLKHASRWLSELYLGVVKDDQSTLQASPISPSYAMAMSLFNCHEYTRCFTFLSSQETSDQKTLFLRFYAQYLAGEKDKQEDGETVLGPRDSSESKVYNRQLVSLRKDLSEMMIQSDTYLQYLYGVVHRNLKNETEAMDAQITAISMNPWNYPAWQELISMMHDTTIVYRIIPKLPRHIMTDIFRINALLDLHLSSDELTTTLDSLDSVFPASPFLKTQRAILAYNAQDFESAEAIFDEIFVSDPWRLDGVDIYSNILFVLERRAKLGFLASRVSKIDRFRPEVCCVIGNYYSLLSDHEKAVQYFRKALKVDMRYLAAWTLMGHEYVELKNTHAAIESYRKAVDINSKDYRAWYGLGQAYEMLEMHYYALNYFQRAAALKPFDVRMWAAVGNCHEKLGRFSEAIKAYKRALLGEGQVDLAYLLKIGDLYERAGDTEEAYKQFKACVSLGKADDEADISRAQLWIQKYEQKH